MATRRQWRDWYGAYFAGSLPYDRVYLGVLGFIAGSLLLLIAGPTPLTLFLASVLMALGLATVARGIGGLRAARRERLRMDDQR